jgi:RNA polymerase sigma-70 factor, ECF subfamily
MDKGAWESAVASGGGAERSGLSPGCFRLKADLDEGGEVELRQAIRLAKAGDMEGHRYLYARYADNVFSYVRKIVRDEHDAEDVTQQVFAKLFRTIGRYEERNVPFAGWILRVARNAAIDYIRSDRLVPCEEVRGAEQQADESRHECRRSLTDALRSLPSEQREVVMMRHLVGLSPLEIAGHLGKSESAIHGLHHRGRRSMQRELARNGSAPALATA